MLIQLLLEDALIEQGYEVHVAASAAEASVALEGGAVRLSGLITDIRLGVGATGWEVAEQARRISPDLPVIYISGDSREEFAARGVPGSVLVTKPFLPEDLIGRLRAMAEKNESRR